MLCTVDNKSGCNFQIFNSCAGNVTPRGLGCKNLIMNYYVIASKGMIYPHLFIIKFLH